MVILASKSPRRKELLHKIYSDFTIIPANIDEDKYPIEKVSYQKALKIAGSHPDDLIIAADTYVLLDGRLYGKPSSGEDAFRMLKELSGRTHQVTTYYTIMIKNKNISLTDKVTSEVVFNNLDERLIRDYIASGSPLDKAGAYGIQDNDKFPIIASYKGSMDNIIGFPVKEIKETLKSLSLLAE